MSEDNRTTHVGNYGLHLFNAYQENNFETLIEDMIEQHVEEDNTKLLLTDYSNWIFTTVVNKFFDEDFQINRTLNLNTSTPKKYLIKVIIV